MHCVPARRCSGRRRDKWGCVRSRTMITRARAYVQPANQEDGWTHPPFEFKKVGDKYLGRGTTDDKGPAIAALFAAKYAHDVGIPLNIRFIWEMEEEIGSTYFDAFLSKHASRLKADSILVSDTIFIGILPSVWIVGEVVTLVSVLVVAMTITIGIVPLSCIDRERI